MRTVRYHLGAEELLELGSSQKLLVRERRPYLSGRRPMISQSQNVYFLDAIGSIAGYLAEGLSFTLNTLGDIVDIPMGILSQGVDITFNGVAGLIGNIPLFGEVLAQILLLGGALIKLGLSIPGLVLHGLGNILGGIAKALQSKNTEGENQDAVDKAKDDIVKKTPPDIQGIVKQALDFSGVTGRNLAPGVKPDGTPIAPAAGTAEGVEPSGKSDLESALSIGIPVVGVVALVAALAS